MMETQAILKEKIGELFNYCTQMAEPKSIRFSEWDIGIDKILTSKEDIPPREYRDKRKLTAQEGESNQFKSINGKVAVAKLPTPPKEEYDDNCSGYGFGCLCRECQEGE